jgi:hypothetical protein
MTSNEELITDLRRISGDYGKKMRGELDPKLTYSWDGDKITAWEAADALEAASRANSTPLSSIVASTIPLDLIRIWLVQQIHELEETMKS